MLILLMITILNLSARELNYQETVADVANGILRNLTIAVIKVFK